MGNGDSKKRPVDDEDAQPLPRPPARRVRNDGVPARFNSQDLRIPDTCQSAHIAAMEKGMINACAQSEQNALREKIRKQNQQLLISFENPIIDGGSEATTEMRSGLLLSANVQSRAFVDACNLEIHTNSQADAARQETGMVLARTQFLLNQQETKIAEQKNIISSLARELSQAGDTPDVSTIKSALGGYVDYVEGTGSESNASDPELLNLRENICQTIGKMVVQQQAGEGTEKKRRVFSKAERAFYGLVLAYAGVLALTFIAYVLGGPAVKQVKKWRSGDVSKMKMGVSEEAINHNMSEIVMPALKDHGLLRAIFILGEDGSALKRFLELVVEDNTIVLYGANGGPHAVSSLQELINVILENGLCTTMYVVSLIPQVGGAPSLPIVVDANDNKMQFTDMHQTTMFILNAAAKNGMKGQIVMGVGDGASFVRKETRALQAHEGEPAEKYLTIDHPFICLKLPFILGYGYYSVTQDFMHIAWRLRTCFLRLSKNLTLITGLEMAPRMLVQASNAGLKLGLLAQDLNYREKQHWPAVLRLSGLDTDGIKNSSILMDLERTPAFLGVAMYLTFMSYYLQVFIGVNETVHSIINKCGWILAFLAIWKMMVESSPELTTKRNFLTHETFMDVVISVTNLLLLIVLFREKFGGVLGLDFNLFRLLPSYISSRFLEYTFAFCRSEHPNATSFGAYAGAVHVNHYHWITKLQAISGIELPTSKRGIPRGTSAIDPRRGFTMADCQEMCDGKICRLLDDAIEQVFTHVMICCQENNLEVTFVPSMEDLKAYVLIPSTFRVSSTFFTIDSRTSEEPVINHEELCDEAEPSDESDIEDPDIHENGSDESDDDEFFEVEGILDDRRLGNGTRIFKIKWLGYGDGLNSWEPEVNIPDRSLINEYDERKLGSKPKPLNPAGERLLDHQDRGSFASDVQTMATAATSGLSKKRTKKQTKREEDHDRMKRAIDLIRQQVDPVTRPAEEPELKKMRAFLSVFNSYISKQSRERKGRFMDQYFTGTGLDQETTKSPISTQDAEVEITDDVSSDDSDDDIPLGILSRRRRRVESSSDDEISDAGSAMMA